jgi:hypothetical protein
MSLTGKTKDILKIALASRSAGKEIADAIELTAWALVAQEVATGTSPSAAFTAALKAGDICEVTDSVAGTTTFAAATADKTFPALTVAIGDLVKASRKAPVRAQAKTGADLFPLG